MNNTKKTSERTGKYEILITEQWYICCGNYNPAMFEAFCTAYEYQKEGIVNNQKSLSELAKNLDKINVNHLFLFKIFDCIYCIRPKDAPDTTQLVTGFCDVTGFLDHIITNDEKVFFETMIRDFMYHGGIVRVNHRDFIRGEETELMNTIINYMNYKLLNNKIN